MSVGPPRATTGCYGPLQRGRSRLHPVTHQPGAAGECRAATGRYGPLQGPYA